jgi:transposase-like protein
MVRSHGCSVPVVSSSAFKGLRFPPEIIVLAVRWYLRFGLSYRDVEELLTERGIEVDHVTVYRWVQRLPRCWSTGRGRVATRSVTGGTWMRPT